MLIALLYREHGKIAAAAPACDVVPFGDAYWREIHETKLPAGELFETAVVEVPDESLQHQLFNVGIDQTICGRELDLILQAKRVTPVDWRQRAA